MNTTLSAAELRARAIRRMEGYERPSPQDIAEADVWARLAISAAISETGNRQETARADH
jgi:hypothetical protein